MLVEELEEPHEELDELVEVAAVHDPEERLIQAVQAAELRGLFGAEYVRSFVAEEVA